MPVISLLLITQSRTKNIPLFLLNNIILLLLDPASTASITLPTLLLAFTTFFASGGTNSVATIDLASAYNGVSSFSAPTVGLLIFVGNWAGSIWWSLAGIEMLLSSAASVDASRRREAFTAHAARLTLFSALSATGVMAACAALRVHLFVWTVFSPKLLYAAAWAVGWHLVVNVVVGGVFAWVG